jgi:hypothetical protein
MLKPNFFIYLVKPDYEHDLSPIYLVNFSSPPPPPQKKTKHEV